MKILIVDDDLALAMLLQRKLRQEAFSAEYVDSGKKALEFLSTNPVDLLILDLNLPDIDGVRICRKVHAEYSGLLILMLTARDKNQDVIDGLDAGADDYLVKPFYIDVLLAHIRALFRRDMQTREPVLQIQDIRLDPAERIVWKNGRRLNLTRKEYGVLEYLMRSPNQVISLEQLLEHVWTSEDNVFTNSPRVHIQSIRNKLGDDSGAPRYIETIIGSGYRFIDPDDGGSHGQ